MPGTNDSFAQIIKNAVNEIDSDYPIGINNECHQYYSVEIIKYFMK